LFCRFHDFWTKRDRLFRWVTSSVTKSEPRLPSPAAPSSSSSSADPGNANVSPAKRFGFVQADPIRAPARAQDLTLRLRVKNYRAGDLERRYAELAVEEDFFVNYGFMPRDRHALMHPRVARRKWSATTKKRAQAILEFVNERASVHPREVAAQFAHGTVTNYWGGLRVVERDHASARGHALSSACCAWCGASKARGSMPCASWPSNR
jgi:hypothetical protein